MFLVGGLSRRLASARAPMACAMFSAESSTSIGEFEYIIAEVRGKSGLITMNRPPVNAMSDAHLQEVRERLSIESII